MADTEELPEYTVVDPGFSLELGLPPPVDNTAFTIGGQSVSHPLVSIEQLKSHLRLLGMFALMKQKVEDPDSDPQVVERIPPLAKALSPERRWVWFLELAVERFRRWATSLNTSGGLFVLPPIDVWMIWHAYMLNPMWYAEDCERLPLLRALRNLKEHPIDLVEGIGDDPFDFRPPPEQEEFWDARIRLPYNPFVSCRVHTHIDINCPQCESPVSVPFLNAGKSGFAQTDFNVVCGDCSSVVTREKLGVAKFTRDAVLDPDDPAHVDAYGKAVYLPGTLLMTSGQINAAVAKETKAKLRRVDAFRNDQNGDSLPYPDNEAWRKAMGEKLKYETSELRQGLEGCLTVPRARKIVGAYMNGKPFSIQLVATAMRQTRFTDKMRQLGWLNPGFFDGPEDAKRLQDCVTRYYGFLTLIPDIGSFSVPTLDIDLVWHTHQLSPKAYKKDCNMYVGKFVNHDDEVEATFLSDGFELTCRAWQSRFGTDYSRCGCSLPGTTLGQRLRRLRKAVLSQRPRMDPPMDPEDCYSASHPSVHNSVFVNTRVRKPRREAWKLRWRRRRNRDGQKIKNSKGKMQNKDLEERHPISQDHDTAAVAPLPLMFGYGYPYESSDYPGLCLGDIAGCSGCEGSSSCSSMG